MEEANLASPSAAPVSHVSGGLLSEAAVAADDVIDLLPIAAYVCDSEGRIVRFNERAARLWGRRPRLGEDGDRYCGSYRLFRPGGEPLAHHECPMATTLRTGVPVCDGEAWIEQPGGRRIYGLVNIDPIRNSAGEVIGAINCFQDITARKAAEEAQRKSEALLNEQERHFHSLLEALPLALYTTDAEGRISYYNEAAAGLWGVRPEPGKSKWCGSWRLYWPDGRPMPHDECPMAVSLKQGRKVCAAEAIAERPDGSRIPFMPYPTLLHNRAGEVIGAVNVLVDITHRKQAEERLHLLINELNHRVKNALATVQSIAALTLRASEPGGYELFEARLGALSRAHDLLARHNWAGATLGSLLSQELAPYREARTARFRVRGEEVPLDAHVALALAMVFHELATNAAKYGSLSRAHGMIDVGWKVLRSVGPGPNGLVLEWTECKGPPVAPPTHRGFGSRLIERNITGQLGGKLDLDYRPDGLHCKIELPLSDDRPSA